MEGSSPSPRLVRCCPIVARAVKIWQTAGALESSDRVANGHCSHVSDCATVKELLVEALRHPEVMAIVSTTLFYYALLTLPHLTVMLFSSSLCFGLLSVYRYDATTNMT